MVLLKENMTIEIILNKESYGKCLPKGNTGDKVKGYSFYEVVKEGENYICSRMTDKPVLEAVTEDQYKNWKKKNMIAYPVQFIWNKDLWKIIS